MNNFRCILKQKCGSRFGMRGVNTHNTCQTPRTLRTGVISRIVSGTNKTILRDRLGKHLETVEDLPTLDSADSEWD